MAEGRERDLVLAPNEYAFILDETKGNVIAYVGQAPDESCQYGQTCNF